MVFSICYCDGCLAKDGDPIQAWTVEDAVRAIGQMMVSLGSKDHCLLGPRNLKNCLLKLFSSWKWIDPPPNQVKPVPITIVAQCVATAQQMNNNFSVAVANMAFTGFFYLNHPGELTYSSEEGLITPF
jgi:hypothetical protein